MESKQQSETDADPSTKLPIDLRISIGHGRRSTLSTKQRQPKPSDEDSELRQTIEDRVEEALQGLEGGEELHDFLTNPTEFVAALVDGLDEVISSPDHRAGPDPRLFRRSLVEVAQVNLISAELRDRHAHREG